MPISMYVPLLAMLFAAITASAGAPPGPPPGWRTELGAGWIVNPEFQGADDYQFLLIPYLDLRYRDDKGELLFANVPQGIGGWLHRRQTSQSSRFNLGLALAPGFAARGDEIAGLEDIPIATEARLYLSGGTQRWRLSLTFAQDLGTGHGGAYADLTLALRGRMQRTGFWSLGPTLRLADADFANAQYGISPDESTASGLPTHNAGRGLVSAGVQGLISRPLGRSKWRWTGILALNGLTGARGDSPIVVSRTQAFALLAITRPLGRGAARAGPKKQRPGTQRAPSTVQEQP